jgi:hypothetical protein
MEGTQVDYTNYLYKGSIDLMPKYVGCYQLGGEFGLRIMIKKKPNWFHRTMMKLCLGWEWIDTSN